MISRTQDLKNSIAGFIIKLETEYETLQWPSVLNSFALLSGQLNTLMKVLRNEKTPPLRNRILLPLFLNPERDEELAKLTENRIQFFNHEVVPDYLRTKPDPEIEAAELQINTKASQMSMDAAQAVFADDFVDVDCNVQAVASLTDEDIVDAVARTQDAQADSSSGDEDRPDEAAATRVLRR
ncbi:hypothetical protein HPB52_008408 [Rhipicephalus sanguineus]|uniref:Mediator of RNA polymerase II transcription subunit 8 n=1 Tax=Rhipicephalus sanguineus TaxID=34632 RepID=A0A9D4PDM0_RHISA|nr:hypothetical protein HPB52_008408 [Rhipicephalus sanguineus]